MISHSTIPRRKSALSLSLSLSASEECSCCKMFSDSTAAEAVATEPPVIGRVKSSSWCASSWCANKKWLNSDQSRNPIRRMARTSPNFLRLVMVVVRACSLRGILVLLLVCCLDGGWDGCSCSHFQQRMLLPVECWLC